MRKRVPFWKLLKLLKARAYDFLLQVLIKPHGCLSLPLYILKKKGCNLTSVELYCPQQEKGIL